MKATSTGFVFILTLLSVLRLRLKHKDGAFGIDSEQKAWYLQKNFAFVDLSSGLTNLLVFKSVSQLLLLLYLTKPGTI